MSHSQLLGLAGVAFVSFVFTYFGASVGLVLGQFRLVFLVYLLGNPARGAATSLAISTVGVMAGSIPHLRNRRVSLSLFLTVGIPSAIGAHLAARYAASVNGTVLKAVIAASIVAAGVDMIGRGRAAAKAPSAAEPSGTRRPLSVAIAIEGCIGFGLGIVSGLIGLLLGALRLPAMIRFARVTPGIAVGTNMAIGAVTGLAGGYAAVAGGKVDIPVFAVVAPLTVVAALLGAARTSKLSLPELHRWAGGALTFTGVLMLIDAGRVLLRHLR